MEHRLQQSRHRLPQARRLLSLTKDLCRMATRLQQSCSRRGSLHRLKKEFEAIVATGTADINTHLCLAHCYLQQKIYSKAVKEFDLLSKHAKTA